MVNYTLSSGTSGDVGYLPNGQVEGAFNGNGGSTWWYEQYLWVGKRLMAYYDPDWNTYFIHRGSNGSSTQITNESGGLAGDMLFYPFGQEWAYDNGVNSAWWQFYNSFSRWNASLGFDLTPNRKYSPTLGRWMTPDPSGMAAASPSNPQTWNMYAYVLNNPTSLVDTSGLQGNCPDGSGSTDGCAPTSVNALIRIPGVSVTVSAQAPVLPTYQEGSTAGQAAPFGMPGGQGGVGGGGGAFGGSAARPALPHKPSCTAAQRMAAEVGNALEEQATTAKWVAFGSGIAAVLSGGGEGFTFGADTPFTISFSSTATFFGGASVVAGTAASVLKSIAAGNTKAIRNFDWTHLSELAATAAASRVPFIGPWAETVGRLAGQAAEISATAEEVCN